ncbi:MAG: 2-aminobenzoate-CoA ligase, partial [Ottowia sp.]|nr:2-aminobenzoate-CoA ligase [Ottowia sp.]
MSPPSAQTDRFVHDRLPPREQWPELRYDLPELRVPDQVNLVHELLGRAGERGWAGRPLFIAPGRTLTYDQAQREVNRIARVLTDELKLQPGNRVLLRGGNS